MRSVPFHELNRTFAEKLGHEVLHQGPYSFLKILQHGLAYAQIGDRRKLIRNYLLLPSWMIWLIYWLKQNHAGHLKTSWKLQPSVVVDEGRTMPDDQGIPRSVYFHRIIQALGRTNVTLIARRKGQGEKDADLAESDIPLAALAPDQTEMGMLRAMKQCHRRLRQSKRFTPQELRYMRSSLHIFFESYRRYRNFFRDQPTKTCFFCVHYHNEGLIAALASFGIRSVEVQHGLISANDFYYVYDPVFASSIQHAFFPDHILLYGEYWKRVLQKGCEWREDQLLVAGDYLLRNIKVGNERKEKEDMILLAAQKNLPEAFSGYAADLHAVLKKKHPGWKLVVKLHPLEKDPGMYHTALDPLGISIAGSEIHLDDLLAKARIQISIYSTTFFDALGHGIVNFSIQQFTSSSDYAAAMVNEGIALPLGRHEDPVDLYLSLPASGRSSISREDVFGPFREEIIRSLA